MKLFNTLSGQLEKIDSKDKTLRLYTCGITPYDSAHIGHAFVFLTYDLIQRRLKDQGYESKCVRNVTDVDDDILKKSRSLGVFYLDLAKEEIAKFESNMKALNLMDPASSPRATSAISDILKVIDTLLSEGYAYKSGDNIYFDVSKYSKFGELSKLSEQEMIKLAAERGGNPEDPNKIHPLDFVLWQKSLDDEPAWSSRWGKGRPGWHVECSALAMREHGGLTLDIHGGGSDLIFPHHECEKAQSECVMKKTFAKLWVHVAMVKYQGEKMSKSLGNLVFISDLLKDYDPMAIRLALMSKHYTKSFEWDNSILTEAESRLELYKKAPKGEGPIDAVRNYLDEDLNVQSALETLDLWAESGRPVFDAAKLLGLKL
jgi:L-cysteine:1D-myo-inositol 2-amino-2-deoxy-alpha-D-glucopyranoside ligase